MIDLRKKAGLETVQETSGHVIKAPKEIIVHVHGGYSIVLILQKPSYGIRPPHAALNHLVDLRFKINFFKKNIYT